MPLASPSSLAALAHTYSIPLPVIITTALPTATVGKAYSAALTATGGVGPFTWRINDGLLPTGLALSSSGLISGTPSKAGNFSFTIICTDFVGQTTSVNILMQH